MDAAPSYHTEENIHEQYFEQEMDVIVPDGKYHQEESYRDVVIPAGKFLPPIESPKYYSTDDSDF